ncbi:ABC transporter permease [Tabrizicola fusiformis]|uniref:ABC transporter permease n=1 Tax=Tabrizicola sp. SY72 TaxID=2741673 RepID=UPI001573E64D|nr:FtsX-like permease family protein [Tabrizicola sp. SY72]NTT84695.1 ABC transporter permease [Tabrizicola sp. SY72]
MSLRLAARIARRELRGGIAGFRIFLACLALGVAAIAGVGMVRSAIEAGMTEQGAVLLGGDGEAQFTYRFATDQERDWLEGISERMSEVVEFRSMAVAGEARVLTQVKAVDGAYPLLGQVELQAGTLAQALAGSGGLPGAVMDPVLADQIGLAVGDRFKLGLQEFRLSGLLRREPDSATGGFALAPRTLVRTVDLAQSGLIAPGTLYDTAYRLDLPEGADLTPLQAEAETRFRDAGMRWSDSRRPAPGVERFVDRIGAFLILVGLAGMAVGGVGVASAVRAWLEGRISTIATLRTLGADGRLVFRAALLQVAVLAVLGVVAGLALGVGLPLALKGPLTAALPFPVELALYPRPVIEAGFYGLTSAFLFALWPLARAERVRAAALYRGGLTGGWPAARHLVTLALLAAALVGGAAWASGAWIMTVSVAGGVLAALVVLGLAALGLGWCARRAARLRAMQGRVALRLALSSVGSPRAGTVQVVLGLGLGLTVLAAVGQIDANLRAAIQRDLPTRAPSFFFVDIQPDQIEPFKAMVTGNPAVSKLESAPMLRGVVTRINGRDAREVAGDHWVVRGDRGLTYADAMPAGTTITEGTWWPEGYSGPPQISFAATEAAEIGLKLGDRITVNVLGREIEAEVTSFRVVDFSNAGMGFVMSMNAGALAGAPHSHIATVYAEPEAEAALLREVATAFPNVTAIGLKAAIARVAEALTAIAQATTIAAMATLVTGFVVLIGAAAAGEGARVYEAAVLKVLGASRGRILASFALRAALTGAAAGGVAVFAGGMAGWAVMHFVMEVDYAFDAGSALMIVAGGVGAVLLASLAFVLRPLGVRPARVLRAQD